MHNQILTAEDLRETTEYIEQLSNAPDNTNGAELDRFSAELILEINGWQLYNHIKHRIKRGD